MPEPTATVATPLSSFHVFLTGRACALAIMSDERRPKRKADAAALDAILQIKEQEEAIDREEKTDGPILEEQDAFAQPILFCGGSVALPKHLFVGEILDFLSKPDLVHSASLVSSAWCNASKDTILWPELDEDIWKKYPVLNNGIPADQVFIFWEQFYDFLRRPQFACLKMLVPPDVYRPRQCKKVLDRIAKICPLLEDLDLSGLSGRRIISTRSVPLLPYGEELTSLPAIFPNLKKLQVSTRFVERGHLVEFSQRMGRLSHFALHHAIVDDEMDDPSDDDPSDDDPSDDDPSDDDPSDDDPSDDDQSDDDPSDSSSDDDSSDSSDSSSDDDSSDSSSDEDSSDSSSDDDSSDSSDSSSDDDSSDSSSDDDSSDSSDEDSSDSSSDDDSSDDEEGPDEGEGPDLD
jgi:hypothetical protein